jgi:hypothetical protein
MLESAGRAHILLWPLTDSGRALGSVRVCFGTAKGPDRNAGP